MHSTCMRHISNFLNAFPDWKSIIEIVGTDKNVSKQIDELYVFCDSSYDFKMGFLAWKLGCFIFSLD
jgi:hypothetical protein